MIFPSCLSFGTGFLPLLLKAVRINHEVAAEENPKYTPKPSFLEGHKTLLSEVVLRLGILRDFKGKNKSAPNRRKWHFKDRFFEVKIRQSFLKKPQGNQRTAKQTHRNKTLILTSQDPQNIPLRVSISYALALWKFNLAARYSSKPLTIDH